MKLIDIIDKLPHGKLGYKIRRISDIKKIIIHHSATKLGSPEAFANYHVNHNGWPGIGYHYVITKDGTVYKTNPVTVISYHAVGANTESIGICLVGNFDEEHPTQAQMEALIQLLKDLMKAYHIPVENVIGHREVPGTKKSCPGKLFDMESLRKTLKGDA